MRKGLIGAKIKKPKWTRQQWKKYRANVLRLRRLNKKNGNGSGLPSGKTGSATSAGTTPTKRGGLYVTGSATARIVGGGLPSLGKR